jgi:hypothetical protein
MKVSEIAKLIEKVDPKRIENLFPSAEDQQRFEAAKGIVIGIVESLQAGALDSICFDQIETAAAEFRALYGRLSPKTQIASRAVLNEAVLWAELGHVERSIFLAGVAREKKVAEPYRSQLNSLPANACCSRYRQLSKLSEAVKMKIGDAAYTELDPLFDEIRRSYLSQFVYFAGQAYLENRSHAMVAYMQTVACLLKAFELDHRGRTSEAAALVASGYDAVHSIPEPSSGSHFMEFQYHRMNLAEFLEMRRLSDKHGEVTSRLRFLAGRATKLKDEGAGRTPKMSYSFAPVVGWGARSVSVAGIILSIAPLLGWDQATLHASIDALWVHAADQIPQFNGNAVSLLNPVLSQSVGLTIRSTGPIAACG